MATHEQRVVPLPLQRQQLTGPWPSRADHTLLAFDSSRRYQRAGAMVDEEEILAEFPPHLRTEMALHMCAPVLGTCHTRLHAIESQLVS